MKKYLILAAALGVIALLVLAVVLSNSQSKDCGSITDQSAKDDCHHALAHETNDKQLCGKISDGEKREHCFGSIPG